MKIILGLLMTISFSGFANSYEKNCFREHIRESIEINKERKLVYREMTRGKSDKIFDTLIASEYLALAPAAYYDFRVRQHQQRGSSIFCHEFMSMNRLGKFDSERRIFPEKERRTFDWKVHKRRLENAIKSRNHKIVRARAINALLELKTQPLYYCMTRHLVESIYRFAYFVPLREQEAQELGLKSPKDLMFDVMKLHLLGFSGSYEIDEWGGPIQKKGIPILCSELPDLIRDIDDKELDELKHR